MAISIGDAVLKITGDTKGLDQSLTDAEKRTKETSEKMKKYLMLAGAAFTAVGVAGLKLVDSARKMNAQLGVTAKNLDITTKEMRDLALETTNVTFPLKEVIASFDLLARAGVEDTKILKDTATAFDTLGDAVGMSASDVTAKMVPAMKTFGLSATEVASKTDLMTNLVRNSTVSLDNFGSVIGYITPELVDMGLTLEDTVALMAIMEAKGMSGEVATRAFRTAITQATREGISLAEALGITSEEMIEYNKKLEGITGMTKEYADEANKQYGIMDKLRQKWAELTLQYGTFLQPLEPILATMTALGPVMMLFSTVLLPRLTFATAAARIKLIALAIATKAVTVAQWLWNAALTANPIGLVILAIAALIAGIVLLVKNWDWVLEQAVKIWGSIERFFTSVFDNLKRIITDFGRNSLDWLKKKFEDIVSPIKETWEWIRNLIGRSPGVVMLGDEMETLGDTLPGQKFIEFTVQALTPALKTIRSLVEWVRNLADMFSDLSHAAVMVTKTFIPDLLMSIQWVISAIREATEETLLYIETLLDIPKEVTTVVTTIHRTIGGGATGGGFAGYSEFEAPLFQHGGIAMRPMLAQIAEKGPEAVIPLDKLEGIGGRSVNIYVELDGRTIGRAVGVPLVEEIRMRTGVRI